MLIIKVSEEKRGFFRFKKRKNFACTSFVINNTVFYVTEISKKDLNNPSFISLLNKFKGSVLNTSDENINSFLKGYLYNPAFYIKRAILSSASKELKGNSVKQNIIIKDNHFTFCPEMLNFTDICKHLCIVGEINSEIIRFKEYCLNQYGLNVFVNDTSLINENVVVLDLDIPFKELYTHIKNGNDYIKIYADQSYFSEDENVKKLTDYGISQVFACAAISKVPYKRVYINKH